MWQPVCPIFKCTSFKIRAKYYTKDKKKMIGKNNNWIAEK